MKNFFTLFTILASIAFSTQAQNPFGNGSDGELTVNEGETLIINTERTTVTGSNFYGTQQIFIDSAASIQAGDEILVISMQDPETDMDENSVGHWEVHNVSSLEAGFFNLSKPLKHTYDTTGGKKHQVLKIPQYTSVNISGTLNCPAWDGHTGGILYFRSNDTVFVHVSGIISSSGKGYRGGTQYGDSHGGGQGGESFIGTGGEGGHYTADPNGKVGAGGGGAAYNGYSGGNGLAGGGGGATGGSVGLGSANLGGAGGGGGGHAGSAGGAGYGTFGYGGNSYGNSNNGQNGGESFSGNGGYHSTGGGGGGGGTYGSADLLKLYLGSGGGCGGRYSGYNPGFGGNGGGLLYISSNTIDCSGVIESNGANGANDSNNSGGGGGAAGGSLLLEAVNIDLSSIISSSGGTGGMGEYGNPGGNGGDGRIRLNSATFTNSGEVYPDPYLGPFLNIVHEQLSNTNDLNGPYEITALITDNEGDPITDAKLHYRINDGAFTEVLMAESKEIQEFSTDIPGQAINSFIEYYISATDGTDNYISPQAAPAELYSFEITGFPPYGLICTDNNDGTVNLNWYPPNDLTNFTHYNIYRSEQENFSPGGINLLMETIIDTAFIDATVSDFHTYYYLVSANYDYDGIPVESFSNYINLLVNNTGQTTVLGYAYLEAQNNHANIKIKFIPESPSAVADSVYTNALGYFENHNIIPGVYSVWYEKPGYQTTFVLEVVTIVEDTDLGETTIYDLGTTVSGDVSGEWNEFISVSGNITVPAGDSLIIDAGTIIRFLGNYHFYVNGYLACNGIEGDTILMTSARANQNQAAGQWKGIDIYNSSNDNSYLHFTLIEYAYEGIYIDQASPTIGNCLVSKCSNRGIYPYNWSHPHIYSSVIGNTNYGIYVNSNCDPLIEGCTILNNSVDGIYFNQGGDNYGRITDNVIMNNVNGFTLRNSNPQIENNLICDNSSNGIYINNSCNARIINNQILRNNYGISINDYYNNPIISYNTVAYNINDGIVLVNYSSGANYPVITYNTIYSNSGDGLDIQNGFDGNETISNNVFSNNHGYGIRSNAYIDAFENNDVFSNTGGEISNLANMPPETWNFISINPNNNTPCDIYRNITEEPHFVFSDSLDFRLQDFSPCINGGSIEVIDPDGSVSDIGAFNFDLGCPHEVFAMAYADQTVSLAWPEVENDSLAEYNVYYKIAETDPDYTLFGNTSDTAIDVTGLTNNVLYDFSITGVYPNYESIYAPKVSERPGVSELTYDPGSYSLIIPYTEDSIVEDFTITNNGSRNLNVNLPCGNSNAGYTYFDGNGDYIYYGDHDHLEGMNSLTMECWIYRENNGHFEFMGKHYNSYQLAISSSEQVYFYKGYGSAGNYNNQAWSTTQYINMNQWYHLAMSWEGSSLKLYVNGELTWEASNADSSPIPADLNYPFEFGRRVGDNNSYLKGRLAEARVWNIARSLEDIRENMYLSLVGNEEGLVGYWPLLDDFDDHSIYGVSATVYGDTHLESASGLPFVLFTLPQEEFILEPEGSEIVPITFYNRDDMSSIFFTTPLFTDDLNQAEVEIEVALQYGEGVPATPIHFIPVPETGKPYTIIITDAEIDEQTIDVGDEIGVFDGELCVGAGIFNGEFNFIFTAWESDQGQGLDGFTPGNDMIFKMYDTSADLETNEAEELYFIGDDTFGYGAFSALSLEASVYNYHNVSITGGQFNLVSFNLLPHYPDAWDVFGAVPGLQIVYNDDGAVLIPEYTINTIGDIDFLEGFYLFTEENTNIMFEGTYIHIEDWDITVSPGKWNYISVLSQNPVAVTEVFAGLEDEVSIVQAASGETWIPDLGVNTIGNMQPGLGYKIALAVDTAVSFSYPEGSKNSGNKYLASVNKRDDQQDLVHFNCIETGLPYAIVLTIKPTIESPFNPVPGDEIGIFDGDLCVGVTVYDGSDQILVTAWEKDELQNLPGYTFGNRIRAKVYKESVGHPTVHNVVQFTGAKAHYGEGNYANLVLEVLPISEETFKFEVLPNPFRDEADIIFSLSKEDVVTVNVFDGSGRLVKSLAHQSYKPDLYQINWNGTDLNGKNLHPGIYFIIAKTTGGVYSEKVIILK